MRRILIDNLLEAKAADFSENLFKLKCKTFKRPLANLEELRDSLGKIKHKHQRLYIQKIIDEYDIIVKASPTKIKDLIFEFSNLIVGDFLDTKINKKDKLKFHERIVKAMRYDELRNSEFHHFVAVTGIKTCVYCNSQLAVVTDFSYYDKKEKKRKPKVMAKFELDHYYSKSKYPFLCTSFYNLYPVCGNCNRAKSDNHIDFEVYTTDPNNLDVFKFWIDEKTILDYWLSPTTSRTTLKVHFEALDGNYDFLNSYNEMFAIQGIYDTQTDLAEELVHKAKVYTDAYQKSLVDNFKGLFRDQSMIKRLIVGNYMESNEIHKRPMSKYSQDLAKQLGLI
ncbi:hypothetical protein ACLI08_07910 [Flavobacterium sp. RNTU_13]|uniref:hypothetical protein n=1 Tax=Flavobacterium sp. RNTU_13 TaxID=3375145 RepID=UPI003986D3A3